MKLVNCLVKLKKNVLKSCICYIENYVEVCSKLLIEKYKSHNISKTKINFKKSNIKQY